MAPSTERRVAKFFAPRTFWIAFLALNCLAVRTLAANDEPPTVRGAWVVTSATRNGEPAEDIVGHRVAFGEQAFEIHDKDGALDYRGTYVLEPDKTPQAIDFRLAGDTAKGTVWRGIYKLEGTRLTICDNAPDTEKQRPTDFAAPRDSGYVLVVLERAKR